MSTTLLYAHLIGNYRFQTSNYALFVYDHMLTFGDEVEKIWKQPFTFASLLFYINRYITHCQFIILQVEFQETNWPLSVRVLYFLLQHLAKVSFRCTRYVKFAGATTLCLVTVADLLLIFRVYALYLKNHYILGFLLAILAGQVIACAWGVHFGIRVPLPQGFPGCVLTGSNSWFAALWGAPLVTDSCIFALTVFRTIYHKRRHGLTSTLQIIIRDGTMYFFVIFSVNLMNCLIYLLAVEDLKAVGASFSQILTAILISRLQLNLRSISYDNGSSGRVGGRRGAISVQQTQSFSFRMKHMADNLNSKDDGTATFFSLGNLGESVESDTYFLEDSNVGKNLRHVIC